MTVSLKYCRALWSFDRQSETLCWALWSFDCKSQTLCRALWSFDCQSETLSDFVVTQLHVSLKHCWALWSFDCQPSTDVTVLISQCMHIDAAELCIWLCRYVCVYVIENVCLASYQSKMFCAA